MARVCGSVLQCVAVCCSMLQYVVTCCVDTYYSGHKLRQESVAVRCSMLQYIAVCCNVLQCVVVCFSVCNMLHRVAVCCNTLQCTMPTHTIVDTDGGESMLQSVAVCIKDDK